MREILWVRQSQRVNGDLGFETDEIGSFKLALPYPKNFPDYTPENDLEIHFG